MKYENKILQHLWDDYYRINVDDWMRETLYHYTSGAGLYGIISTGVLMKQRIVIRIQTMDF